MPLTGTAGVSIPLGAVAGKQLSMPIELSYHASGVKVSDYGSWVGLGWSLKAGGIISRSVNGLPDKTLSRGYWNSPYPIPNQQDLLPRPHPNNYSRRVANNLEDTQADLFSLVYPEGTATFMMNKNGEPVFFPHQDIDISMTRSGNSGNDLLSFLVVAPSGNRYTFAAREVTWVNNPASQRIEIYPTAWALTLVENASGTERIELHYASEDYTLSASKQYVEYFDYGTQPSYCHAPAPQVLESQIEIQGAKRLTQIEHFPSRAKAVFTPNSQSRTDIVGMHLLNQVNFYLDNQHLKSWGFTYSTFASQPAAQARFKLEQLRERGRNSGVAKPPYVFHYDNQALPAVDNVNIDHWGYYTGRTDHLFLPADNVFRNRFGAVLHLNGADRSADPSLNGQYMKMGVLKEIHYPMGGRRVLEYEPHTYSIDDRNQGVQKDYTDQRFINLECEGCFMTDSSFTSNYEGYAKINYSFSCGSCSNGSVPMEAPSFDLWHVDSSKIIYGANAGTTYPYSNTAWVYLYENQTYRLKLESIGNPSWAGRVRASVEYTILLSDSTSSPVDTALSTGQRRAGGLRIKQISSYPNTSPNTVPSLVRHFNYNKMSNKGLSSGHLLEMPRYYQVHRTETMLNDPLGSSIWTGRVWLPCTFIKRSANQTLRNIGSGSGHIYYQEVRETIGDGGQGFSRTIYHPYTPDIGYNYYPYPQRRPIGHLLGLVAQEEAYNSAGNLVQQQSYHYTEGPVKGTIKDLAVGMDASGPPELTTYTYVRRDFESKALYLDQTIATQYNYESGVDSMVTITNYTYDPNHLQPTEVVTTLPDGQQRIQRYQYSGNYAASLTSTDPRLQALAKLQEQNRNTVIIEATSWQQEIGQSPELLGAAIQDLTILPTDEVVVEKIHKIFLDQPLSQAQFQVSSSDGQNLSYDSRYEQLGEYLGYDDNNNPLGFQRVQTNTAGTIKDLPFSLLWDDEGLLPVASAVGASPEVLGMTSFEGSDQAAWTINGLQDGSSQLVTGKVGINALSSTQEFPVGQIFAPQGDKAQAEVYTFSAWVNTTQSSNAYLVLRTLNQNGSWAATFPNSNTTSSYIQTMLPNTNGNWELVEIEIDLGAIRASGQVPVGQNLFIHAYVWNAAQQTITIDELRFAPKKALVESYVYDNETRQITNKVDANRLSARFEYDDFLRLKAAYDHENNLLAYQDYQYQSSPYFTSGVDHNYVQTQLVRIAGQEISDLANLTTGELNTSYQYLDGLGRPLQSIQQASSSKGNDVVAFHEYDQYGQESRQYLPYEASQETGLYINNPQIEQQAFYQGANSPLEGLSQTAYAYQEVVLENSPLMRVKEQSAVGDGWQLGAGHTVKSDYEYNAANEVWRLNAGQASLTYYHAATLQKQVLYNEQGVQTVSYVDVLGQTILVKQQVPLTMPSSPSFNDWAHTYTVYDDFGRVEAVITPLAMQTMNQTGNYDYTQTALTELVYTYKYDARGRLIEKKIPNTAKMQYVYDRLDRVVATQDGRQAQAGKWLIQKYDERGREILSALYQSSLSRADLQQFFDNQTSVFETRSAGTVGYTNTLPVLASSDEIQAINYYDDYDFDRNGQPDFTYSVKPEYPAAPFLSIEGQPTGSKVRVLDPASNTATFLTQVLYYDDRGRLIQSQSSNHLGGWDNSYQKYDFLGQVVQSRQEHLTMQGSSTTVINTEQWMEYDHAGRLTKVYHKIGNEAKILLSSHYYDELGRMIEKNLHSTNGGSNYLQSIDYHYNAKGWLVGINDLLGVNPASTGGGYSSASNTLSQRLNELVVEYSSEDLEEGASETAIEVNEEIVELVNGVVTTTYQLETQLTLIAGDSTNNSNNNSNPGTRDTSATVDMSDQEVTAQNLEAVLDSLRARLTAKLQDNGLNNSAVEQALLEELQAQYRDRWLLLRANDQHEDNEDLYQQHLAYNWVGNIHHQAWKVRSFDYRSLYDYQYDGLNRLTSAQYQEYLESSTPMLPAFQHQDYYSVPQIQYDVMGNITSLDRKGTTQVNGSTLTNGWLDKLTYQYQGNQLLSIQDQGAATEGFKDGVNSSQEYFYDSNGNLVQDNNKGLNLTYNYLNLPSQMTFNDPTGTLLGQLEFVYDATGQKLQKRNIAANGTTVVRDYVGNVEYENGEFEFIQHTEGRIVRTQTGVNSKGWPVYDYTYEYSIKDHLGNARVFFSDRDKDGIVTVVQAAGSGNELIQQAHYYPFGMEIRGDWKFDLAQSGVVNAYQYNGKELNEDYGLGWNDYSARWYDAALGRWQAIDPLAEKYAPYSSYNYVLNNPIHSIDPDGKDVYLIIFATNDGNFGHAVLAVDIYDEAGQPTGNVRYFDLNPAKTVGGLGALFNVEPSYGSSIAVVTLDKIINSDYIDRNNGAPENEAKIPDGVIRFKTDQKIDQAVISKMLAVKKKGKKYNAAKYNCTDYVCEGLFIIDSDVRELATEKIKVFGIKSRTPNELYKNLAEKAKKDKKIEVIKDPKEKVTPSFLKGGKGTEKEKKADAEKEENDNDKSTTKE